VNARRHRQRVGLGNPGKSRIERQNESRLLPLFELIQALLRVTEAITGLRVRVTCQIVFPAGLTMRRRDRRIEIEAIAMLEANIALVDELYIGPTTKN